MGELVAINGSKTHGWTDRNNRQ